MHVVLLALLASGCSAFRADIGPGIGIGADVQIPAVLHTGFGVGYYTYVGHNYGEGWRAFNDWEMGDTLIFVHLATDEQYYRHFCFAFLPIVTTIDEDHAGPDLPQGWHRLEVGLFALFIGVRLGVDPWAFFSPPAPQKF